MTASVVLALVGLLSAAPSATFRTNDAELDALWKSAEENRTADAADDLGGVYRARAQWWYSGGSQAWEAALERITSAKDASDHGGALTLPMHLWQFALHNGSPVKREARIARELLESVGSAADAQGLLQGVEPVEGLTLGTTAASAWYAGAWVLLDGFLDADQQTAARERYGKIIGALRKDCLAGTLYAAQPGGPISYPANLMMLYFGLVPAEQRGPVLEYLQREAATCPAPLRPLLIEAAFRNGAANFGYAQLLQLKGSPAVLCLLPECVLGLYPAGAAWSRAGVSPPAVSGLSELHLTLPLPAGTITAHHVPGVGYAITATTGLPVEVNAPEGVSVSVRSQHAAAAALTSEERAVLSSARWKDEVGEALAAWVDVDRQRFFLIENGEAVWQVACATAAAGAGSEAGSQKTPLGWHQVAQKFGEGAPWGQVFRSRAATKEIWKPGDDVTEDMVLTRVLWLDGLEPGKNKGTAASGVNVDSKARFIYIHGTNGEALIGTPSSHGCIRLYNNDVIEAFARLSVGSKVLITGTG